MKGALGALTKLRWGEDFRKQFKTLPAISLFYPFFPSRSTVSKFWGGHAIIYTPYSQSPDIRCVANY